RVVAEAIGVPLRQHYDGLPGARRILVRGCRVPAGVDQVVFGIRCALRRGEAEELRRFERAISSLRAQGRVLGKCFRPHIGGEKLRASLFEAEVGGALVAEEDVAVADEVLVDADHCSLSRYWIAFGFRCWNIAGESVCPQKGRDPLEATLERPHHAVFIARG